MNRSRTTNDTISFESQDEADPSLDQAGLSVIASLMMRSCTSHPEKRELKDDEIMYDPSLDQIKANKRRQPTEKLEAIPLTSKARTINIGMKRKVEH